MIADLHNCVTWNGTYGATNVQAVTATAVSAGAIDLLVAKDIAPGRKIRLVVNTLVAVTRAAGAATVTFEIITADDAALTNDVTVIAASVAIDKALLVAGAPQVIVEANPIVATAAGTPPLTNTGRRYLGCRFTVSNTLDTGSFTAYFSENQDVEPRLYASGFSV